MKMVKNCSPEITPVTAKYANTTVNMSVTRLFIVKRFAILLLKSLMTSLLHFRRYSRKVFHLIEKHLGVSIST